MKLAIITLAAMAAVSTAAVAASTAEKTSPLGAAPPKGAGLPSGQCIRSSEIRNHTFLDNRTMLIDVNGKATYRVTSGGSCFAGAVSSDPIVMRNPPGSSLICKPIDLDLGVSKGGFTTPCIVESIVKLTPDEVARVPKKLRP
ncbi:MAG: hypothetical protein JNK30_13325 [Phenylobacterium sp.]|uniref:DUF6491 family protein n=1 Tax=Phenylobacterium sp. TaxID=1871053 RepID=UPI001A5C3BE2|nr:DUF6491 family protein [Phenylobacterium sp.]MBL8772356.1 hypothetical protein [Phenylobacterium sp.]